jgi:hypothetical protein
LYQRASKKCDLSNLRRVWCVATGEQAHTRTSHVSLHQWIHRKSGRHRNGHHRTTSLFFCLFWRTLFGLAPQQIRRNVGRKNSRTWFRCLVGQHRMVWRRVWNRQTYHPHQYPLHHQCHPQRRPYRCRIQNRSCLWFACAQNMPRCDGQHPMAQKHLGQCKQLRRKSRTLGPSLQAKLQTIRIRNKQGNYPSRPSITIFAEKSPASGDAGDFLYPSISSSKPKHLLTTLICDFGASYHRLHAHYMDIPQWTFRHCRVTYYTRHKR